MDVAKTSDLIAERIKASPPVPKPIRVDTTDGRLASLAVVAAKLDRAGRERLLDQIAQSTPEWHAALKRALEASDPEEDAAPQAPQPLQAADLAGFEPWLRNPDLEEYLTRCLVPGGYVASGLSVHDLAAIRDSTVAGCSPGGFLLPFGYLVIAKGIGGDEVCVGTDGRVYWAGHETFADSITYQHPETGALEDWEYTPENVRRALIPLSDSFEDFLIPFLSDELRERLDELD
jgi:hypothetical protein